MNLSRRTLFQTAALVPLGAVRGSAANGAVKIGLIGAGSRGTYDARTLARDPRVRITAICDVSDEQIANAKTRIPAPGAQTFKNYRDLLATDVDAVVIATPVFLHPEHLEAAVKAGKHVYIEKPAAVDVAGAKHVIRVADSADRKLNITFGFQQRHGTVYKNAKQMLDSGAIGKVREVHTQFIKFALKGDEPQVPKPVTEEEKLRQWKLWRSMFGEVIVETYCHNIDAMNWFMDARPLKAIGTGGRTVEKRGDLLDHMNVTFDYPGNVQATLIGSQIAPRFYRVNHERYIGENGVIETAREYWTHDLGKGPVTEKSPREITIDALEGFVTRLVEGKPENTGVRGAESTLTALLGQMAIDLKREVTWDEMMRSA